MEVIRSAGLTVEREVFGEHFATNCYVVSPDGGAGAVVIDPGQDSAGWVGERLATHGRTLGGVLVTHGHMDHTWDAVAVLREHPAPLFVHAADRRFVARPADALPAHFPAQLLRGHPGSLPEDCRDVPDRPFEVGGVGVVAVHSPGHTPGSSCFIIGGTFLATGDTWLASGPGPVFPPWGCAQDHASSVGALRALAGVLERVLPGHGPTFAASDMALMSNRGL